ncbi:MAG: NmrA/HSCARG family protein [Sphingopyxis sp.]|nr:NmrA/HSCARG family protein [Sphingopyxis sp.]
MTDDQTITVFGATGQQGGAVARSLREAGWQVRAFVRDPSGDAAKRLEAAGCVLVQGDMADRASVERALLGAYGVFSVQPSSGQGVYGVSDADEVAFGTSIAEAAQRADVRHFVYSSVGIAGSAPTGMGHFDSKLAIERHLNALPLPSTVIRPSTFMEILMLPGLGLDQGYLTFFPYPDQIAQFIAVEDIGRIVAAVFAQPDRFVGQTLEIASDAITGEDLATKLSEEAKREIRYQRFPEPVLAENPFLQKLADLFDGKRLAANADVAMLRKLVPELHTFDTWLKGPGKQLLIEALQASGAAVALR